jgi:hypothetical protein
VIATPSDHSVAAGAWILLGFLREQWQSRPRDFIEHVMRLGCIAMVVTPPM